MRTLGRQLATGRTADIFAYGNDSVAKVLRDSMPGEWALIEFDLARRIHGLDLPTPEPRAVLDLGGRQAVVFERVDGPSMQTAVIAGHMAVTDAADLLADIHRQVLACEPPPGMPSAADRLAAKILLVDAITEGERRAGRQLAYSLCTGWCLLHGDLHPNNVIMAESGPVIIDWYDASVGPPVTDIARSNLLMSSLDSEFEQELAVDGGDGARTTYTPHLPGATVELLDVFRGRYLEQMKSVLDESGIDDDTWRSCLAVTALGRVAERACPDSGPLLALWRSRPPWACGSVSPPADGDPPRAVTGTP